MEGIIRDNEWQRTYVVNLVNFINETDDNYNISLIENTLLEFLLKQLNEPMLNILKKQHGYQGDCVCPSSIYRSIEFINVDKKQDDPFDKFIGFWKVQRYSESFEIDDVSVTFSGTHWDIFDFHVEPEWDDHEWEEIEPGVA